MAEKLGWRTRKGLVNKTLANRMLNFLIVDKLVERKRGKLSLTKAGKEAIKAAETAPF